MALRQRTFSPKPFKRKDIPLDKENTANRFKISLMSRNPPPAKALKRRVSFSETVNVLEFQKGEVFSVGDRGSDVQPLVREESTIPMLSDLIAQAASLIAEQSPLPTDKHKISFPQSPLIVGSPVDAVLSPGGADMSMDVSVMAFDTTMNIDTTKAIRSQLDNLLADSSLQQPAAPKATDEGDSELEPADGEKTMLGMDMSMDASLDVSRMDNETVPVKQKLTFLLADPEIVVAKEATADVSSMAMSLDYSLDTHALRDLVAEPTQEIAKAHSDSLDTKALRALVEDSGDESEAEQAKPVDRSLDTHALKDLVNDMSEIADQTGHFGPARADETIAREVSMSMDMTSFHAPDITVAETSMAVNNKLERLLEQTGIYDESALPVQAAAEENTVDIKSKLDKLVEAADRQTPRRITTTTRLTERTPASEQKRKTNIKSKLAALIASPALLESPTRAEGDSLLAMPQLDGSALVDYTDDVTNFRPVPGKEKEEVAVAPAPAPAPAPVVEAQQPAVFPAKDQPSVVEPSPVKEAKAASPVKHATSVKLVTPVKTPEPVPPEAPVAAATAEAEKSEALNVATAVRKAASPRWRQSNKGASPRPYRDLLTPLDMRIILKGFLAEVKTPDVSRVLEMQDSFVEEGSQSQLLRDIDIKWARQQVSMLTELNAQLAQENAAAESSANELYPLFKSSEAQIDADLAEIRNACELEAKIAWQGLKAGMAADLTAALHASEEALREQHSEIRFRRQELQEASVQGAKRQKIELNDADTKTFFRESHLRAARIQDLQRELQVLRRSRPLSIYNRHVHIVFSSPATHRRFELELELRPDYPMSPCQYAVRPAFGIAEAEVHTAVQRVKLGYGYVTRLSDVLAKLL